MYKNTTNENTMVPSDIRTMDDKNNHGKQHFLHNNKNNSFLDPGRIQFDAASPEKHFQSCPDMICSLSSRNL